MAAPDGRAVRIDLHSHAGRCFFCGMPPGTSFGVTASELATSLDAAAAADMTAVVLATVSDLPVLGFDEAR